MHQHRQGDAYRPGVARQRSECAGSLHQRRQQPRLVPSGDHRGGLGGIAQAGQVVFGLALSLRLPCLPLAHKSDLLGQLEVILRGSGQSLLQATDCSSVLV